jgi:hypothetical protein
MMCCISSIGPDETNTETKNEACVTNNAAVDLWKDLPTHLPNRMDWNPWSLLISRSRSESSRYEYPRNVDSSYHVAYCDFSI